MPEPTRSAKAEETRRTIVASALKLFRVGGYDGTTMRAIADDAGVSLGSAYYYFASKEHLIQAYYDAIQDQHEAASAAALGSSKFVDRLTGVWLAWVEVADPYHEFAGAFFKNAAEPTSPLSPFSAESTPTRDQAVALMAKVIDGSDLKVTGALRQELPELLWLAQMGVVLFWVHDRSPDRRATRALVRQVVPIIDKLIRLTRLPGVRGIVNDVLDLVGSLRTLRASAQ